MIDGLEFVVLYTDEDLNRQMGHCKGRREAPTLNHRNILVLYGLVQ